MKSASHVRIQNGPGSLLKAASEGLDNGVWLSMGGRGRFRRRTAYPNGWHPSPAREVPRLTGWTGKIWEKRYQPIPISDEEEAQVERFRYVLGHGVKENLVAHLREWPGLHCIRQLADGEPLTGTWYDRT